MALNSASFVISKSLTVTERLLKGASVRNGIEVFVMASLE